MERIIKEIIGEIQKGIPDLTDSAYPSASDLFLWSIFLNRSENGMLSCIMKEDELYNILKAQYSKEENRDSIKLYLSSLRCIEDKELEDRKKELQKILREQQHKLSK